MQRRGFVSKAIAFPLAIALPGAAMAQVPGHATRTTDFLGVEPLSERQQLAAAADQAYTRFRQTVPVAGEFMARSQGVLIFPEVSRAGLVVGMAQGDGMLVVRGQQPLFYRQKSKSLGFQVGVQRYSQVYVFLQPQALMNFVTNPAKWNVGIDATVAVAYAGAQDAIDTAQLNQPVVAFTFDNEGLMAGVSLSATQIFPQS